MEVKIFDRTNRKEREASILKAIKKDMPKKKDGWQFAWRSLFKVEGSEIYKLVLNENPEKIEGVVMLSLMNDEMLYMNNIEVAPHNYGSGGQYDKVAACLIAFACLKSFELGRNGYEGFLTFESKTNLIRFYQNKYGSTLAAGQRMFIEPAKGIGLIDQFLKMKL